MRISVIGSPALTTIVACFADLGHDIVNIDTDETSSWVINDGRALIHKESFLEIIDAHAGPNGTGQLQPVTDYQSVFDTDVTFLYLPTL